MCTCCESPGCNENLLSPKSRALIQRLRDDITEAARWADAVDNILLWHRLRDAAADADNYLAMASPSENAP